MISVKRFLLVGLLFVFLVGNIGLGIFTHSCENSGVEKSFFVKGEDPCDDHHKTKEAKSCCHESCEQESEIHDDCCSTDIEYVHLSLDQRVSEQNHPSVIIASENVCDFLIFFEPVIFQESKEFDKNTPDPPILQGRKIHKLNQIFVI